MPTFIALLRGINVGRAKRVAMAELRDLASGLGFAEARTVLNSGNLLFEHHETTPEALAAGLREAIEKRFGISVHVVVLRGDALEEIIQSNPLGEAIPDPGKYLVAFPSGMAALKAIEALLQRTWGPDHLVVGERAAYLWCASGILESDLFKAFAKATGETVTTRNWSTVLKLQAALR